MSEASKIMCLTTEKSTGLQGRLTIPGDKSISHRALMFAALAVGESKIYGLLEGEDVLSTAQALRDMGADISSEISPDGDRVWTVHGVGVGGLQQPQTALDMGNSGTSARLLMGLLATHPIEVTMIGDASLSTRPMKRVITPLSGTGAQFSYREGGVLPVHIKGTKFSVPVSYKLPVASAQVKSAVLLSGLNCSGVTEVIETVATRDHTENMLSRLGADISVTQKDGETRIRLVGPAELKAQNVHVPSDPSSAAFFIVAALITEGSDILLPHICLNPTRSGLITTLLEMGADIEIQNEREEAGEIIADLRVRSSALKGVVVPAERAASMIDEYPILSVAAACASGDTVMLGVGELRVKESDRIAMVEHGLAQAGIKTSSTADSLTVTGGRVLGGGTVETALDHRIAMSFAVLGLVAEKRLQIVGAEAISTSFPNFILLMQDLGARMQVDHLESQA